MPIRTLPAQGRPSPRFRHQGVWNLSLGPHSPVPGRRLQVAIIDQTGRAVRGFEQIRGDCIDPGHVDFFLSHNCRPSRHEYPLVDIDERGEIVQVLHPNFTPETSMEIYLQLLTTWAQEHGRTEYAL